MDLWVVAAAAGAGYIAKNLQNLSVDKKESLAKYSYNVQSESRNFLQQLRDKTCPLRRLGRKGFQNDSFIDDKNDSDVNFSEIDRFGGRGRGREDGVASSSAEESLESENSEGRSRGKLVRSRRCGLHSKRPSNSLGSCIENMECGACLCPSVSTVRPLLVTDGVWGSDSSFGEFEGGREEGKGGNTVFPPSSKQFESVVGIGRLEEGSSGLQLSGCRDTRSSSSQGPETMCLFIMGITIGILSATTSWKTEVDKLNKQLKQMENLVQDLQEELDMKETLMVKELDEKGDRSIQEPISSPSDIEKLNDFDSSKKNAENLELLSRIEAELQAELEMLEKNMKTTALERISNVIELDADFEPEVVEGDLKTTMVNAASDSGNETTETTTNCSKPANYAVSPWELSVRLHELIESKLETRIKELEIALDHSQNTVSGRRFSYSETESSSTHQSPTCVCDEHDKTQTYPSTENFCSSYVDAGKERDEILLRATENDQESANSMSNEDSMSEDDEGSDESDMLLIKQIVQRRKSSSSFNLLID